jgi:hypothetical protein
MTKNSFLIGAAANGFTRPVLKRFFGAAQIFLLGRQAAPDVPLGFVPVKDPPRLCSKAGVDVTKPLGDVLMYRAFAQSKFSGSVTDSGTCADNVFTQTDGSFIRISLHTLASLFPAADQSRRFC